MEENCNFALLNLKFKSLFHLGVKEKTKLSTEVSAEPQLGDPRAPFTRLAFHGHGGHPGCRLTLPCPRLQAVILSLVEPEAPAYTQHFVCP